MESGDGGLDKSQKFWRNDQAWRRESDRIVILPDPTS